jgi:NADH-quinone oxidoreductase subunit L
MKGTHLTASGEHLAIAAAHNTSTELLLMAASVILVLISVYLGYYLYRKNISAAGSLKNRFSAIHTILHGKYFVDEFYGAAIVRPIVNGSLFLWKIFDVFVIDGIANGLATIIADISRGLRPVQTGRLRTYATIFLTGAIILIGYFIFR